MISRKEFEKMLLQPATFWQKLSAEEIGKWFGPETARMKDYDQNNPHHYFDLWNHTIHTVEALADAPAPVRTAAFFHDIGKPDTMKNRQGRSTFYGHALRSAAIAGPLLEQIGYRPEEIQEILFYIRHHDDFIQLPDVPSASQIQKKAAKIRRSDDFPEGNPELILKNLLLLCQADASAQAKSGVLNGRPIATRKEKMEKLKRISGALFPE